MKAVKNFVLLFVMKYNGVLSEQEYKELVPEVCNEALFAALKDCDENIVTEARLILCERMAQWSIDDLYLATRCDYAPIVIEAIHHLSRQEDVDQQVFVNGMLAQLAKCSNKIIRKVAVLELNVRINGSKRLREALFCE